MDFEGDKLIAEITHQKRPLVVIVVQIHLVVTLESLLKDQPVHVILLLELLDPANEVIHIDELRLADGGLLLRCRDHDGLPCFLCYSRHG